MIFEDAQWKRRNKTRWLAEIGLERRAIDRVIFSGRGFHVRVAEHDLELKEEIPQRRLEEYRELREPLVEELERRGVLFDSEVTLNPKGLIRLVGSIHGTTGFKVTPIADLERFNIEEVERVFAHEPPSPATSAGGMTEKNRKGDQDSPTGQRLSEQADTPTTFFFIRSEVIGTVNRQVLLLRFPTRTSLDEIRSRLHSLLQQENLAPFYLFESRSYDHAYYALTPTAIEQEHLPRLLRNSLKEK